MARFNTETDRTRDGTNFTLYAHIMPNNKKYFGITSQEVCGRWQHDGVGYSYQPLIWRAIQKYGWDNIQHIVLADHLSKEWACKLEQNLIWKYKSNNPKYGYNNTLGGEGTIGYKLTTDQKEKIRIASTGRYHSQETKEKLSKLFTGRYVSQETRKRMSESHKNKPSPLKGTRFSEEHKRALSKSKLGKPGNHCKPHSEKTKQAISESCKGRVISKETREKLRQKALEQWKRVKQKENEVVT